MVRIEADAVQAADPKPDTRISPQYKPWKKTTPDTKPKRIDFPRDPATYEPPVYPPPPTLSEVEEPPGLDDDKIATADTVAAALAANLVREYGDEIAGLIANGVMTA